jgi:hypothetical protein
MCNIFSWNHLDKLSKLNRKFSPKLIRPLALKIVSVVGIVASMKHAVSSLYLSGLKNSQPESPKKLTGALYLIISDGF